MRVLFLSTDYPTSSNKSGSGVGTFVYRMAHALTERGFDTGVICWPQNKANTDFIDAGVSVFYTRPVGNIHYFASKLPFIPNSWVGFIREMEMNFVATQKMSELCANNKTPTIVEIPNSANIFWNRFKNLKKIPYVIMLHGSYYLHQKEVKKKIGIVGQFVEWLDKRFMAKAQAIISPSNFVADYYGAFFRNVYIIPPIIAFSSHAIPWDYSYLFNEADKKTTVLSVSALGRDKGINILAEAIICVMSKSKKIQFVIVGADGDISAQTLRKRFEQEGVLESVKIEGYVAWDQIEHYYNICDIYVSASLCETFGQTIAEAMLLGKPIVATRAGAIPEIVIDRVTGLLVEPSDSVALANGILELADNKALAHRLGNAGAEKVRRECGAGDIVSQRIDLYQKILSNRSI